jgi:hypothetical protein
VSEWELLFTTLPLDQEHSHQWVEIDVLSTAGILYRGRLANWFVDVDGKLSGIFLSKAERYMKDDLGRDREKNIIKSRAEYWREIPGANLYLPASSLVNYNIRYVEPTEPEIMEEELGENIVVTPIPGPHDDPSAKPVASQHPSRSTSR